MRTVRLIGSATYPEEVKGEKRCIWESLGPPATVRGQGPTRMQRPGGWAPRTLEGPSIPQEADNHLPQGPASLYPGPPPIANQANERLSGPTHSPSVICSPPFSLILLPPQQFPRTWGLGFQRVDPRWLNERGCFPAAGCLSWVQGRGGQHGRGQQL